jgi:hypothetical protein
MSVIMSVIMRIRRGTLRLAIFGYLPFPPMKYPDLLLKWPYGSIHDGPLVPFEVSKVALPEYLKWPSLEYLNNGTFELPIVAFSRYVKVALSKPVWRNPHLMFDKY